MPSSQSMCARIAAHRTPCEQPREQPATPTCPTRAQRACSCKCASTFAWARRLYACRWRNIVFLEVDLLRTRVDACYFDATGRKIPTLTCYTLPLLFLFVMQFGMQTHFDFFFNFFISSGPPFAKCIVKRMNANFEFSHYYTSSALSTPSSPHDLPLRRSMPHGCTTCVLHFVRHRRVRYILSVVRVATRWTEIV